MLIALTGATGFIGRNIQKALLERGHQLRLLTRSQGPFSKPSPDFSASAPTPGVASHAVAISDADACARALDGVEAFIHLVGIIAETPAQRFERVHGALTRHWLQAARRAGVSRWLQMSALGTRPQARSRYHQTKWEAEEAVRQGGLPWTIFRPSIVHGPGDAFTHFFARMARWSPFLPAIGGGRNLMQPIAVEQVAQAFAESLAHPGTQGATYDLCGPERLPLRDILRLILELTGRRRAVVTVPWAVARLQARFLEGFLTGLLGRASPLTRDQLLMLEEDNVGDGGPADRELGLVHAPFREALARHLRSRGTGHDRDAPLPRARPRP